MSKPATHTASLNVVSNHTLSTSLFGTLHTLLAMKNHWPVSAAPPKHNSKTDHIAFNHSKVKITDVDNGNERQTTSVNLGNADHKSCTTNKTHMAVSWRFMICMALT